MRTALVCALLSLLSLQSRSARAQAIDSTAALAQPDTSGLTQSFEHWVAGNWHQPNTTKLERVSYVIGASAMFSLADYIGFNLIKRSQGPDHFDGAPIWFRFAEAGLQTLLSYILYDRVGLGATVSFNLIWWTWGDDFGYYGWGYLLGLFPWESSHESGLRFHEYTTAGWTPIGLMRAQGSPIAKSTLMAQSAIGLSAAIALDW